MEEELRLDDILMTDEGELKREVAILCRESCSSGDIFKIISNLRKRTTDRRY